MAQQFDPKTFRESLGSFGTTTAPGENQLTALQAKIRQGVKHVELHLANVSKGEFGKLDVPDKYGIEQRRTIMQLAKLNEQSLSVHGTFNVNSFSGLSKNGFDEMERQKNISEIDETVKFASQTAKGGAVVFHLHETQIPSSAGEMNLSENYMKFLKNNKDKRYKKEYERLNKELNQVSKNPFEKRFQENPNLESEMKVKFQRELEENPDLKNKLIGNGFETNHIGYFEYLEKQKLELEQDGLPYAVVGESLTKVDRNQEIIDVEKLKTNYDDFTEKEKNFLKDNYVDLDEIKNQEVSNNEFDRLKELVSDKDVNNRLNSQKLSQEEFVILKKKFSKEYYDVYKKVGRRKSTADKIYQKEILDSQIKQMNLQLNELKMNRNKFADYIEEIDELKREEVNLSRKLQLAMDNGDKIEEDRIRKMLIGGDGEGKKLRERYIKELYPKNSVDDVEKIISLQQKIELAREGQTNFTQEDQDQLTMLTQKLEKNQNLSDIRKEDLNNRIFRGRGYISKGGVKGALDYLNYEFLGQTEFSKFENYDRQASQIQEQVKKLEEKRNGVKGLTDEILERNTLSMSDMGIRALDYQLDLYERSLTSKDKAKEIDEQILELQKKSENSFDNNEKFKLQNEIAKKRLELRKYIGVSDYKDIVGERNGKKEILNPLYLAPENIMAGYGFMSNIEEYKSAIRLSWKDFSDKILSNDPKYKKVKEKYEKLLGEKITKENAFEVAKKHISGTFDNAHAGTWLKYFKKKNGESEEKRLKRFNSWLNTQAEDMAKEGIIKHIHLNDTMAKDDDHNLIGQGILDVFDLKDRLRGAGIKEAMIVEAGGRGANSNLHLLNAFEVFNPLLRKSSGYGGEEFNNNFNEPNQNVSDWVTSKRVYENRVQYSSYGMNTNTFKFESPKNENFKGGWSGSSFI